MKRFRLAFAVCIAGVCVAASSARADLAVTMYAANQAGGGLDIQAQYDAADIDPDCCDLDNVRWIQRVLLTDDMGNRVDTVPGFPNGDFIDPQTGGTFDNDPWYDFTYNTAADRATPANEQLGAGRFYNDSPSGWLPFGEINFEAMTLIVCVDFQNMTFEFLGGFSWGFNINADQDLVTTMPLGILADTAALRGIFNDALDDGDFASDGWEMVEGDVDCYVDVRVVPEPGTFALLGIGITTLGVPSLRRRYRAA